MAELESVLDMYGIAVGGHGCQIFPLPDRPKDDRCVQRPYLILSFPLEDAARLSDNSKEINKWDSTTVERQKGIGEMLSSCTLIKSVVELWGYGTTIDDCSSLTRKWIAEPKLGKSIFQKYAAIDQSWKISIHTLGAKYTKDEHAEMRNQFSFIGFQGPVKMEDPDQQYIFIQEPEMGKDGNPLYPRHGLKKEIIPENAARPPLGCYFGRILSGFRGRNRAGLDGYSLKKRCYLGPTSMDAELSFIMTSLGQVKKGSICFDPFVGTGSILLSCGIRGGFCIGSDIDVRVIRGRSKEETIWKNFEQFGLARPEIVRTDNSLYHRHFRQHTPIYDAIICDPPYGIRAGAKKTGSRRNATRPILEEHRDDHIAQTKPYPVCDVMADLLDVAARSLRMGGRLVYVIPSYQEFDPQTDLPRHSCLELVHSCYQPLGPELGRRFVAMKKVADYDESLRDQYMESVWVNGKESAEKCANIREKIMENARKKPGYEEKLAVRREKRKQTKEAKKQAKRAARESSHSAPSEQT